MSARVSVVVVVLLAAGALTASGQGWPFAGDGSGKTGGTLNVAIPEVELTDPTLAYLASWQQQLEYATALKLLNYPDRSGQGGSTLVPEAAAAMPRITNHGKTYTFTIRKGLRLSDGSKVTARNFKAAIDRSATQAMRSPAVPFMGSVVGYAAAVQGGQSPAHVRGVIAKGNHLIIDLNQADGGLLAKLAMPFFQAIPPTMPIAPQGVNVYASGGPYAVTAYSPTQVVLSRNPFYRGERPKYADKVVFSVVPSGEQRVQRVETGQCDVDAQVDGAQADDLHQTYGVNTGRYFVNPMLWTYYFALNTQGPLFTGNPRLRQAVNYAIDRSALTRLFIRSYGADAASPTDRILPPGMPGYHNQAIYPRNVPNYAKANALANGHRGTGVVVVWHAQGGIGAELAALLKQDLAPIDLSVRDQTFPSESAALGAASVRGAKFDIVAGAAFSEYADPWTIMNVLDGQNIHAQDNNNLAYFNDPAINEKLQRAAGLTGSARYKAYDALDIEITSKYAPWASYSIRNDREFFSSRIDPKSIVLSPIYSVDLSALALK